MINEKYIFKDLEVKNQQEVFERLGQLLIEDNIVKDGFIQALMDRDKEFPTGLPVDPGVAIPHTDGSLVNEDCLVFATLKNPVRFNEMGGDEEDFVDVQVIILIAIANGQQHLTILQKLIESIQKEGFIKGLIDSSNEQEMKALIERNI